MADLQLGVRLARAWRSFANPSVCNRCMRQTQRRTLATQATASQGQRDAELEETSSLAGPQQVKREFDPLKVPRSRKRQLVPSRYQFRSPKYYRGPLHPHQPPPPSDPASREFVPGPFSSPRLEQTYHHIIAPDFMTLCYQHTPPGFRPPQKGPRLRPWIGESPYFKNRPLRGPRGGDVLRLLRKPITFRNIPMIERVTVHAYVKGALTGGSGFIHVAGMALQAITNHRVVTHESKKNEANWSLVRGKTVSMTVDLKGEDMYHFLGKLINVVLPRIKDWNGVRGTTGDNSGNLTFGLDPEAVAGFPEIETNYDAYPGKMIPGMHITIHTTATCDKDARLLLEQIGIPFYGKVVD
ncbi:Large ribosomal subunit protein uL5m [Exophiala dermatitidis]